MPEEFKEVWMWFRKLSQRRQSGFGLSAIAYTEMQAFFNLHGIVPTSQDITLIETFDNKTLEFAHKKQNTAKPKPKSKA